MTISCEDIFTWLFNVLSLSSVASASGPRLLSVCRHWCRWKIGFFAFQQFYKDVKALLKCSGGNMLIPLVASKKQLSILLKRQRFHHSGSLYLSIYSVTIELYYFFFVRTSLDFIVQILNVNVVHLCFFAVLWRLRYDIRYLILNVKFHQVIFNEAFHYGIFIHHKWD